MLRSGLQKISNCSASTEKQNIRRNTYRLDTSGQASRAHVDSHMFLKSGTIVHEVRVGEPLIKGRYGSIRRGVHVFTGRQVVVKTERYLHQSSIRIEKNVYDRLQNSPGFPKVFFSGKEKEKIVLVLERLGKTLIEKCNADGLPSIQAIAMISISIINRLESLHELGIVHQNLNPTKIMFGQIEKGTDKKVYLIDFGNAARFCMPGVSHIESRPVSGVSRTTHFSPMNCHRGRAQGRRDDLESLLYIMAYMQHGRLPWPEGLSSEEAHYRKQDVSGKELFEGMPHPFVLFFHVVRSLSFSEKPNYERLRNLLRSTLSN